MRTNLIQLRVRKIVIRVKYFFFVISHHSYLFDSENPRLIIMTNMLHCCTQFIFVTIHCLCPFITVTILTRGRSGWFTSTSLPCLTLHSLAVGSSLEISVRNHKDIRVSSVQCPVSVSTHCPRVGRVTGLVAVVRAAEVFSVSLQIAKMFPSCAPHRCSPPAHHHHWLRINT